VTRGGGLALGGVNFQSGGGTLWAVVLGAVLATFSGFLANQLEAYMRRRERQRGAALLFGEILSVLELITMLAHEARGRGEPYGPMTMRLLRAVRRETETYERNREALYDLGDAKVRGQIHALMVRVIVSLEGVAEATVQIEQAEFALRGLDPDHPDRADAQARLEALLENRENAFDFAVETVGRAPPVIALLRPMAKQDFGVYASVVRDP
jgi:hypothetical protein